MKETNKLYVYGMVGALILAGVCCYGKVNGGRKNLTAKTEESTVTTNDNGVISRVFTESSVTTNGCMVTEHRRETRTNTDLDGNVLESSTSEFDQSYSIGNGWVDMTAKSETTEESNTETDSSNDSFLGLQFGAEFADAEFVEDPDQPALLRASFTPEKSLDGFDEYIVYVTPKSHRVVKIFACAKEAVDPSPRWRNHYLIEALEKRYGTWARPTSYHRPCFVLTIGFDRYVSVCLAGASSEYQTVIAAWDNAVANEALVEYEQVRNEARKSAAEKRTQRVNAAAEAF